MGYIEQGLMEGEEVVFKTRLHWGIVFWRAVDLAITAAFVAGCAVAGWYAIKRWPAEWGWVYLLVGAMAFALFLSFLTAIGTVVSFLTTEFGVTNKRVLVKMGLLRRQSLEFMLSQVEGVSVDQNFWGRLLGYGTIIIMGSGGTKQTFKSIASPFELRKKLAEQIEALEKRPRKR